MIKVLISGEVLKKRHTGVENYTIGLIRALSRSGDVELSVLLPQRRHAEAREILGDVEVVAPSSRFPKDQFREFDVIHFPTVRVPLLALPSPRPARIMTVHDLVPLVMPEHHQLSYRVYFRFALPRILRRMHRILAVSESTRTDLIRLLGIEPSRVFVHHQAARWPAPPQSPSFEEREPLVLFVGTLEPRKNLNRAIAAFDRFSQRNSDRPHRLVCVGRKGWGAQPGRLSGSDEAASVRWSGWIDDEALRRLYLRARALLFPSLYEGFGLPVLEAMSQGCPVITSNVSSLPQVAGEAALLVDPEDPEAIASALEDLLIDPNSWSHWAARGRARADMFSWSRCADETIQAYRSAIDAIS